MSTMYSEGYYTGKIVRWGLGKSKDKGTPLVEFSIQITGKKESGKVVSCHQAERQVVHYFTPNTIGFVVRDLTALGYNHSTFDQLDPAHTDAYDFEGKEVELACKHEVYKEQDRERWDFALAGMGGGLVKPIDRKEISKLNAMFGEHLKSKPSNGPVQQTKAKVATAAAKTTEEQAEEIF